MIVCFVYCSLTTARAFTFQSSSPTAYILRTNTHRQVATTARPLCSIGAEQIFRQ